MAGLDGAEARFIVGVSERTGIDPRVLVGWADAEGAYAPGGTRGFNYLNIRGSGSAGASSGGFANYASVLDAINATAKTLGGSAYAGVRSTVARPNETARDQIEAIAASPWDAGHYGGVGGPRLQQAFAARFTANALDTPANPPSSAGAVTATVGTPSASDATSFDPVSGPASAVGDALGSVGRLIKFLLSVRFLELVGGLALLLVGLSILSRQLGGPALVPSRFTPGGVGG